MQRKYGRSRCQIVSEDKKNTKKNIVKQPKRFYPFFSLHCIKWKKKS